MTHVSAIDEAIQMQPDYQPNEAVASRLQHKNILMFVAPAAAGKTFLMKQVAAMNEAFKCVPIFTTRPARTDDDPGMFRVMPHDNTHVENIVQKIKAGEIVQYVVHPSGRFYGTEPQDFPGEYNMHATLSSAVDGISRLPFKQTLVVGIVTDPATWEAWFNGRFPAGSEERLKRLAEAIASLEWLLARPHGSLIWIRNIPSHSSVAAKTLIDTVLYNKDAEDASDIAKAMMHRARQMQG